MSTTLRAHGKPPMIVVRQGTTKGYAEISKGGCFDSAFPGSKTRRGRVQDGGNTTAALTTDNTMRVLEEEQPLRIRRLTPRECFRLQGWTDEYFERAKLVNSDSQLYKQAGNGVTVNVIQAIAEQL